VYACLLCLIGLGAAGCQPASSDPPVVAIVNGRMITQEEFDYRWKELADATRARYERAGGKRQFLEELITHELFMQEAKKLGLDQSQSIRDRTHQYREKLILDELVRQRVKTSVEVSKSEVDAYLASHAHELLLPVKVRPAIIVSPDACWPTGWISESWPSAFRWTRPRARKAATWAPFAKARPVTNWNP
jgi:peptidyl-prolyl cis-trans isomerase C